jgi:hypothetical protein
MDESEFDCLEAEIMTDRAMRIAESIREGYSKFTTDLGVKAFEKELGALLSDDPDLDRDRAILKALSRTHAQAVIAGVAMYLAMDEERSGH